MRCCVRGSAAAFQLLAFCATGRLLAATAPAKAVHAATQSAVCVEDCGATFAWAKVNKRATAAASQRHSARVNRKMQASTAEWGQADCRAATAAAPNQAQSEPNWQQQQRRRQPLRELFVSGAPESQNGSRCFSMANLTISSIDDAADDDQPQTSQLPLLQAASTLVQATAAAAAAGIANTRHSQSVSHSVCPIESAQQQTLVRPFACSHSHSHWRSHCKPTNQRCALARPITSHPIYHHLTIIHCMHNS